MTEVRPVSDTLQIVAIKELNEVPERIPQDLEDLRTWVKQQKYLHARTDTQFLLAFLRGCKYSLERAKNKIDRYYTLRTKFPELFHITNVNDAKFREVVNMGVMLLLPTPLHEQGPRIAVLRNGIYSPDKFEFEDIFRVGLAMQEIMMMEDDFSTIYGTLTVMDAEGVTFGHFFQMTPPLMKKISLYSEEAMPFRQKGSHFINTPPGFYQIFNVFKPMLSVKQQTRLYVHGDNLAQLYEHVPQKYLPKEYGGENSNIPDIIDYWNKKFDEYTEFFKENDKYGTEEKLRPGKPIDFDNMFGVDGSFRKLTVD